MYRIGAWRWWHCWWYQIDRRIVILDHGGLGHRRALWHDHHPCFAHLFCAWDIEDVALVDQASAKVTFLRCSHSNCHSNTLFSNLMGEGGLCPLHSVTGLASKAVLVTHGKAGGDLPCSRIRARYSVAYTQVSQHVTAVLDHGLDERLATDNQIR